MLVCAECSVWPAGSAVLFYSYSANFDLGRFIPV